ncbi:hypothetical protein J6590_036414 [Homalodisca vitripennis]|nr:hypothetical protein J6590_036414 [Homalodisca vitripennis]
MAWRASQRLGSRKRMSVSSTLSLSPSTCIICCCRQPAFYLPDLSQHRHCVFSFPRVHRKTENSGFFLTFHGRYTSIMDFYLPRRRSDTAVTAYNVAVHVGVATVPPVRHDRWSQPEMPRCR